MDDVRPELEAVIARLQRILVLVAPEKTLPTVIVDAIATRFSTKGQQEDAWATAVLRLKAGDDPSVIADDIYRMTDDGE